ncbi:tetratricopeptide repeat-containing glycosyltransferase family 2 protein [Sulfobacillus thermosulfidooxidans]|uniref:tetratricopeptide repeat-containing glycosyltransferase family 2 protein n=1 Tax=Sulfobacillus thermosulfidooxidans TaxID=28034 RepID=UPI00031B6CF0|nr:glycosyltransferase family 2 protein [Sulfobacillus thermosulfidooxidans]
MKRMAPEVAPVTVETMQEITNMLRAEQYPRVQETVVGLLRDNPTIAQLWVFLAEALEHLNKKSEAWACYDRAWILDPAAAWAPATKERLKAHINGRIPKWLKSLLEVPPVSISAAMIVKNEAGTIADAVKQLLKAVDEVVVVDTGSEDDTVALAKEAGAKVFSYTWQDDFGAARNEALSHVQSDWVLFVDGDEVLEEEDIEVPQIIAGLFNAQDPPFIFRIVQVNHMGNTIEPNYDMSRLFPTRFGLRWWGRIHEQVGPPEGGVFATIYNRPVARIRLHHTGYQPDVMLQKQKLERNIALLRKTVEEDPQDVAAWGFLGREYYLIGQLEEAVRALYQAEGLAAANPNYGRVAEVRSYLTEALIKLDRLEEALQVTKRMVRDMPQFPGGWYLKARVELTIAVKMLDEAKVSFAESRNRAPSYRGIVSYDSAIPSFRAIVGLADVAKLQGRLNDAVTLYKQALQAKPDAKEVEAQLKYLEAQSRQIVQRS